MNTSILVAGIGNIFHGDDGFGVAVAAKLASDLLPANVRVVDYGIRGIDLIFALLEGCDMLILVDAVSRGLPPGTVCAIEPDLRDITGGSTFDNAHRLDPLKVLATAREMGARLGKILVVGCEPASLDDIGLSEAVTAAIDPAIEMVRSLIQTERVAV